MKIYIASDHAGYDMKNTLLHFLIEQGHNVIDCGPYEFNETDDYPDYVAEVASYVSKDPEGNWGIVIGGSGEGEAIMANRFPNVRAVVYNGECSPLDGRKAPDKIALTREHNNANVLSLGSWFLTDQQAKDSVLRWLATPFTEEERHVRRLQKIEKLAPHGGSDSADNLSL
jgi:ribose 5-phosphate isomerase B